MHRVLPPVQAGLGLKPAQLEAALARPEALDMVEIHAENAMGAGGPLLRAYERMRERWPMSVHGVGLSIGGEGPLDAVHLERLAGVVRRFEPAWVSEHLAWSTHAGVFHADLLPVAYDLPTLHRVCAHVDAVQSRLGRRLLLENPSRYLASETSTLGEAQFLDEVVRRTGCGLLLDLNNAVVSAVNLGDDVRRYLDALPRAAIGQLHLAGHTVERDEDGGRLLIDTHGAPVDALVWTLLDELLANTGPLPTLLERDRDVPAWPVLEAEVARARERLRLAAASAPAWPAGQPLRSAA